MTGMLLGTVLYWILLQFPVSRDWDNLACHPCRPHVTRET